MGDYVICPGCGWTGDVDKLTRGSCPRCEYENGVPPNRLLTLSEMRESDVEYNDVRLDLFLEAYIKLLRRERSQMNQDEQLARIEKLEQEVALGKEQRLQVVANAAVITKQNERITELEQRIEKLEAALANSLTMNGITRARGVYTTASE